MSKMENDKWLIMQEIRKIKYMIHQYVDEAMQFPPSIPLILLLIIGWMGEIITDADDEFRLHRSPLLQTGASTRHCTDQPCVMRSDGNWSNKTRMIYQLWETAVAAVQWEERAANRTISHRQFCRFLSLIFVLVLFDSFWRMSWRSWNTNMSQLRRVATNVEIKWNLSIMKSVKNEKKIY